MYYAGDPTKQVLLSDSTLRDGSHAIKHKLSKELVAEYCQKVDLTGIAWVEVGHGNGLGASSNHVGISLDDDRELLQAAREALSVPKLSVHVMPGTATFERDIGPAIDIGVDIFRVGAHVSEADTTSSHIERIASLGKTAVGVLMMVHRATPEVIVDQAKNMLESGATAIMLMDSAGALRMVDVRDRVSALVNSLGVPVGFHAHNNLGLAVANSLVAVENGATILDGCAGGFGAGAGNAPMEILIPLLEEQNLSSARADLYFEVVDWALNNVGTTSGAPSTGSVATGLAGLFSGFLLPVKKAALEYEINEYELIRELGKHLPVAGQEDLIIELADYLRQNR
jgi:4-hydroxy 2-oxovalerate aldolase